MYLIPLLRLNKAISTSLPAHPIQAIAAAEIITVLGPFNSSEMYKKIFTLFMTIIYAPQFVNYIINNYYNKLYYQTQTYFLLFFILNLKIYSQYYLL